MVNKSPHATSQVKYKTTQLFTSGKLLFNSFDNFGAYVLDVRWSPIHPGLFAAVDLTGKLSFWNLNTDTEVP